MWRRILIWLTAIVGVSLAGATDDGRPIPFAVHIPANWANATRLRLIFEEVTVPGNVPLKLRVTAVTQGGQEEFVGSTGIEALGRDEFKPHELLLVQLDVTRSLRELLKDHPEKKTIDLRVQAVDGRNNPIPKLKWSYNKARLEVR